ncbi:hypothetical protein DACRYDRAFT_19022 [Dacryopinax primogenitus]|uniref:Uncharacterized protein n=1 Tax=Dacryopinax primogenitus (strain DJM 731) TaxID=1858805 RepID=M5FZN8_DACPD|nr:uncharacterized protein DACRYDRAFT_19022 [Dacryopinax primogenitus]EJT96972.1 hypothetical protein DACRYDRAFT_19022 [Dacryopinax primogenitus]
MTAATVPNAWFFYFKHHPHTDLHTMGPTQEESLSNSTLFEEPREGYGMTVYPYPQAVQETVCKPPNSTLAQNREVADISQVQHLQVQNPGLQQDTGRKIQDKYSEAEQLKTTTIYAQRQAKEQAEELVANTVVDSDCLREELHCTRTRHAQTKVHLQWAGGQLAELEWLKLEGKKLSMALLCKLEQTSEELASHLNMFLQDQTTSISTSEVSSTSLPHQSSISALGFLSAPQPLNKQYTVKWDKSKNINKEVAFTLNFTWDVTKEFLSSDHNESKEEDEDHNNNKELEDRYASDGAITPPIQRHCLCKLTHQYHLQVSPTKGIAKVGTTEGLDFGMSKTIVQAVWDKILKYGQRLKACSEFEKAHGWDRTLFVMLDLMSDEWSLAGEEMCPGYPNWHKWHNKWVEKISQHLQVPCCLID